MEPMSQEITEADLARYRRNYLVEMDGIALYRALARAEKDEKRAAIFAKMAAAEERHAQRWLRLIRAGGGEVPRYRPGVRVRLLGWMARRFGTQKVLPIISGLEARDEAGYLHQPEAAGLPAQERAHSRALREMARGLSGYEGIMGRERWHAVGRAGSMRAAVFGINDGLVSNFSLVMGFAGAEASPEYIVLAGVAGLLAGSFSMAAGEYVSVRAQRELFEQQIAMEKQELEMSPKEEEEELSLIYQAKGIPEKEAALMARRIIQNPETAVDTLAREELGLDPSELGSPWAAAASSFLAFVVGAAFPVLPYLFLSGFGAWVASTLLSCLALFGVGALVSIFTARGPLVSGMRTLAIGLLASAVTYSVGRLLGVSAVG
ncbi:MAG TPA: VIT1/CCC1 transporter family protein [candidate division Zixibacteria bacterium]|nr:VIT1/CCC1 transporter family protein [candidate division Zixibacteria bacterium]